MRGDSSPSSLSQDPAEIARGKERKHLEVRALRRVLLTGLGFSLVYGIVARLAFGLSYDENDATLGPGFWDRTFSVMSVAFLFFVPFTMGFSAVYLARIQTWKRALWFPQMSSLAALALAMVFNIEGLICVVFWLPSYLSLTAIGGFIAWLVLRRQRNTTTFFGVVVLLPYGVAVAEQAVPTELQKRRVDTHIDVQAPAHAVWEEIVDVPLIEEREHSFAWSHVIGFPRPVSARSSSGQVGALREARFERGVVFYERVTRAEPGVALEFDISVDGRSIPKGALDDHVTLGGPYFDVLQGTYRIERRGEGVRLHLASEHRLSTHFNGYAGWWTDFVMRDVQDYILAIVARRAEQRASAERTTPADNAAP